MKEEGYKIRDQAAIHFITFATVQWVDVFTRFCYVETVLNSLNFCIKEKGLQVYSWCVMSNHIHFIISAKNGNLSDILRDFKKFTSATILKQIENNNIESRKGWMLWIFRQAGSNNSRNNKYQFWQQDNRPINIETEKLSSGKLQYIHNNPVRAGLVESPEDYLLSSARDYNGKKGLIPIEFLDAAFSLRY